jgi:hypothetical protein
MARVIDHEGGTAILSDIVRLLSRFHLALEQSQIQAAASSLAIRELIHQDVDSRRFEFKIDLVRLWLDRYQRFGAVAEAFRKSSSGSQLSGSQPSSARAAPGGVV